MTRASIRHRVATAISEPRHDPPPARLHLAREREDLLLLAAACAVVPLGWLLLGWRWPLCVSGYDAWATALPLMKALTEAGGDWSALAYRPDLLGGIRLRDAVGPNPLVALLARAGLHATGVYDLAAFVLQALIGFLGARTAIDLAHTWSAGQARAALHAWPGRLGALLLCAFAPALGWRFGYGHLALTTGLLPFAAALALAAAAGARRIGVTLGVVAALATADGLLFTGHQLVLYGALFGAPLLAGLWISARAPARTLTWPAVVLAAGLLLAWPALRGVLDQGLGGDSPRAPQGMRITYSYLTANGSDWLSSIPWTRAAIPRGRPPLHHHETNLPLGPLLALLALVPWRRLRPLAWGLGVSAALVVAFSMDVRPLSTALIAAIPPLGSFRVPTRAALPLMLALPAMAAAAVLSLPLRGRAVRPAAAWLLGLGGCAALFLLPPLGRELLGWTVAVAVAGRRWAPRFPLEPVAAGLLLALGGGAAGAFGERLLRPFRDTEALLAGARALGQAVTGQRAELRSPLARVELRAEMPELGANTAFAAGLSSLDGYFFPSRRLIALACALRQQPYNPSAFVLRFRAEEAASRALFQLYDVGWIARTGSPPGTAAVPSVPEGVPPPVPLYVGAVDVVPWGPTAGPAWFSARVEPVASVEALAAVLRQEGDGLHERARRTVWTVDADPAAAALPAATGSCAQATIAGVHASERGEFALQVRTPADCPLTLATNYAESLRGRVLVAGAWREARLFPAYGALLGVWVPAGTTEIEITPR